MNEITSLQNQVKASRLQGKLAKRNFLEVMKIVIEPVNKAKKNASEDVRNRDDNVRKEQQSTSDFTRQMFGCNE